MRASQSHLKLFFDFVIHRQWIHYQKEILSRPFPWTNDPVLRQYHFCNVFRELDRGTRYLLDFFSSLKNREITEQEILYHVVIYRHFNQHVFFSLLQDAFESNSSFYPHLKTLHAGKIPFLRNEAARREFSQLLDATKDRHRALYNVAYRVAPVVVVKSHPDKRKHVQFTFMLQQLSKQIDAYLEKMLTAKDPAKAHQALQQLPGIGPFLAYEIWTDLSYFPWFPWTDDEFVVVGPGAAAGLAIIFGRQPSFYVNQKGVDHCLWLREVQEEWLPDLSEEKWNISWHDITFSKSSRYPWLSLRNIEHSLCEFRKYWNIKHGTGRRRVYRPKKKSLP